MRKWQTGRGSSTAQGQGNSHLPMIIVSFYLFVCLLVQSSRALFSGNWPHDSLQQLIKTVDKNIKNTPQQYHKNICLLTGSPHFQMNFLLDIFFWRQVKLAFLICISNSLLMWIRISTLSPNRFFYKLRKRCRSEEQNKQFF